jgi:hypothetical protein
MGQNLMDGIMLMFFAMFFMLVSVLTYGFSFTYDSTAEEPPDVCCKSAVQFLWLCRYRRAVLDTYFNGVSSILNVFCKQLLMPMASAFMRFRQLFLSYFILLGNLGKFLETWGLIKWFYCTFCSQPGN